MDCKVHIYWGEGQHQREKAQVGRDVFMCINRRCVVYKRVTRSHLIWKSHLLSFHTKLLSIFPGLFSVGGGSGERAGTGWNMWGWFLYTFLFAFSLNGFRQQHRMPANTGIPIQGWLLNHYLKGLSNNGHKTFFLAFSSLPFISVFGSAGH